MSPPRALQVYAIIAGGPAALSGQIMVGDEVSPRAPRTRRTRATRRKVLTGYGVSRLDLGARSCP